MKRFWLMVLSAVSVAAPAWADPVESLSAAPPRSNPWTFTIYWENDGGILKRNHVEDRHYTNGIAITAAGPADLADRIGEVIPFGKGMDRTAVGLVAGQLMFTPENLSSPDLIEDDRPYAGYLYGGGYWQRSDGFTFDHLELNVGVTGPASQAENVQDAVHDLFAGIQPRGWDHQLKDEAQVQAFLRRKWRFELDPVELGGPGAPQRVIQVQFIPQVGAALGTVYRHLEAAATLRAGWRLPDDFGPGRLSDLASAMGESPGHGWYGYGYARAAGRAVEHDVFLAGNNFSSSHSVDEEPLVGELTAGVAVGYRGDRWAGEVGYSQTVVSETFKEQHGSDEYASLSVSLTGWF